MVSNHHSSRERAWSLLPALFVVLLLSFSACKKNDDSTPTPSTVNDLINNGNGSSNQFTIFRTAVRQAGLSGALSQAGNYTVFAPTNAAFQAFGYADTNAIKAAPATLLTAVIQYHILTSKLTASAIPTAVNTPVQTLSGGTLYITKGASTSATSTTATSATAISVNGARVVSTSGEASNGIVHAIDRVLLPPVFGDVATTIQGIPTILPTASFTYLNAAVTRAGLVSSLTATSGGPITVFAPTDAAFTASVPSLTSVAAVSALPVAQLQQILAYHIVPNNRLYTPLITNASSLSTALPGSILTAGVSTTGVTVTGKSNGTSASNITGPDITASNGVVHIIDRLLLP
ncbi:fasciclin domain-containing protein [Spirosoma oryzicola]|uniref:fasciclin domain-containing protein n=1 Tax=Spirosoma oryzicola TaxID=2898794 RepID=UPI001E649DDC|nr:fasciclin domain-containing protein [Spirosoma oryzicola]UHG89850.1 fasciclin domain-containing protein [Spirosoma oryzicola]